MNKRLFALVLSLLTVFSCTFTFSVQGANYTEKDILSVADGIIEWKKSDNESESEYLINEKFLELAGTTPGDWYPIGLSRLGKEDNFSGYLAVIKDKVQERYSQSGKLSAAKATEWHRISLAVLASGGDPTNMGTDENGNVINLIADGTYDRGKSTSLGRQGINGWIWGLITVDSMRYDIPDGSYYTRDDIITEILRQQRADGGFTLSGDSADTDITAMAIQALAPYRNSEKIYTFENYQSKKQTKKAVYEVIDEALDCLSKMQLETGDFESWGTENAESTSQVAVALCCLGIDPLSDERFIKNGNTLLDGMLRYRQDDGGFVHSYKYDSDNPSSLPDKSNSMASEQVLYTMAAIYRQKENMRTLYDFRKEQSSELKNRISSLESEISKISENTSVSEIEGLLKKYYSIPEKERSYVSNYRLLSSQAKKCGIDISEIADTVDIIESSDSDSESDVLLYFSNSDKNAVDGLSENLTTKDYVTVTTLLDKLENCEDFDGKDTYLQKLKKAKDDIAKIQNEIDSINADIKEKLYPLEDMSLKDKKTVDSIYSRCNALSEYDRRKIEHIDDIIKTKTKIDSLFRAIIIGAVLFSVGLVILFFLIKRIKMRRKKKELEMEELSRLYENEE